MDSKYYCMDTASPNTQFNSFSVKKKFSNGMNLYSNANSGIPVAKKVKKSNEIFFSKGLSGGSSSSVGSTFVAPHISIEDQRKQLPVYQVKAR